MRVLYFVGPAAAPASRIAGSGKNIPLDNIVLETDAAPQPFKKYRHNWTEPRHVQTVAQKLAEIKGISLDEVAQTTSRNLTRLLRLERLIEQG